MKLVYGSCRIIDVLMIWWSLSRKGNYEWVHVELLVNDEIGYVMMIIVLSLVLSWIYGLRLRDNETELWEVDVTFGFTP